MIVFSAPGRASIVGNPTDMYGGAVISCSLGLRAYATSRAHRRLRLDICGVAQEAATVADLVRDGSPTDVGIAVLRFIEAVRVGRRREIAFLEGIGTGEVAAILTKAGPPSRLALVARTQIPLKGGLGGSTAILLTLLAAVLDRSSVRLGSYQLAEMARFVEYRHLGVCCGYQDAYMAVFGGLAHLDFHDKEPLTQAPAEPFATVEDLSAYGEELPIVVAHSGIQHSSSAVHRPIRERWEQGVARVRRSYERLERLVPPAKKALLTKDWPRLGELMNVNHDLQRRLGGSMEENERLIAVALEAGAWGAKLAGAGGGGTVIALHPHPEALARAFRRAGARRIIPLCLAPGLAAASMRATALEEMATE